MIRKFILVLILVSLNHSSLPQSDWEWIFPYPPRQPVHCSDIKDNKAYFWSAGSKIIKMDLVTDSFVVLPRYGEIPTCAPGDSYNQMIAFADSSTGYLTDVCSGEFRTTNGGLTWTKTATSGPAYLICFGSKTIGWKIGWGGFYRTVNAGFSWAVKTLVGSGFSSYGYFTKIFAMNENQLWILSRGSNSNGSGAGVWYSSNSGAAWSLVNTGLVSDSLNRIDYTDIKMDSSGVGYITGAIYRNYPSLSGGFILKTTDFGGTWSQTFFEEELFRQIIMFNETEAVVFGNENNSGQLNTNSFIQRRTSDVGNTWLLLKPTTESSYFRTAVYSNSLDVIVVPTLSGFIKSIDRGLTYKEIITESSLIVSDIAFDSKPTDPEKQLGIAWLKWNAKPIAITTDGGKTWKQKEMPSEMLYNWFYEIAEEVIYAVGGQTRLLKSTDYGESWKFIYSGSFGSAYGSLKVYDKNNLTVSAFKSLYSSTDGGVTWKSAPFVSNLIIKKLEIVKPGNIFGVGYLYENSINTGTFLRTSDFGHSWHIIDSENLIFDITMLNELDGYALGEKSIYKTTDGGESWKTKFTNQGNWYSNLSSFIVKDKDNLIAQASQPGLTYSTDGGAFWKMLDYKIPISGFSKMLFNTNGDLFMIVGGNMVMIPSSKLPFKANSNPKTIDDKDGDELFQSYPNPFNLTSNIKFSISKTCFVRLKIFNIIGEEVKVLSDQVFSEGTYSINWNAENLPSGIYFCRLETGTKVQTQKMILLK